MVLSQIVQRIQPLSHYLTGIKEEFEKRTDLPELSLSELPHFNRKIWGLKVGLTVIGARTSMGKSAFVLQAAYDLANQGKHTLFLSLEMTVENLLERLFCNVMEVDNYELLTGKFKATPLYQEKWEMFSKIISKIPLLISCGIGKDFEEVNMLIEQLNPKPRVVIVDYIQSVRSGDRERENLNEYIRRFRELCLTYKIAGILCSQINRMVTKDNNYEPSLENLKSTGCIHPDSIVEGKTIKTIVDNKIDIYLSSYDTDKNQEVKVKPNRYVYTGKKRCLKIKTKSGKEIILSNGTELYDGKVWRQARTYIKGEKILVDFSRDK